MNRASTLLSLLAILVCGCVSNNEVELTIFHTNDIHSHLKASKTEPFGLGGVAKLATVLKERRAKVPLSIAIDAGDWSEATMYYNIDTGTNMLELLDRLGFGAAALGNHDFLNGPDRLIQTVNDAKVSLSVLASNVEVSKYPRKDEFVRAVPPYVILNAGPLKVGVIGLTTFELLYDSYIAPVQITNPIDAANRIALELRPQVDVLLISSHNSWETNQEIARAVLGVDAVISGHSHQKISRATTVKNAGRDVAVVESYEWGKYLGELTLAVNPATKAVHMKGWQLHPITPDTPEDPATRAFVDEQDRKLAQRYGDLNQTIATVDRDLLKVDNWETPLGNLAARAYREATGADLALEQTSFTSVGLAKGALSKQDLHDVMPHIYNPVTGKEWMLKLWNARGSDLQLVMTVFYSISSLTPFSNPLGWLLVDNATVIWDPTKATAHDPLPIRSVQIAGKALDPSARYRVVLSEGLLYGIQQANEKLSIGVDLSQLSDTGIEAWQSIVSYGSRHPALPLEDLRVGKRVLAQGPDVGIYDYGFSWDGDQLSLEVENLGLAPAQKSLVTCYSGVSNDLILYGTPEQKWTMIGHAPVAPLAPNGTEGNATRVLIHWHQKDLAPGYWPVRCVADAPGDTYAPNNEVSRVFHSAGGNPTARN